MPCRFASSGTVATSRSASRAILALNVASNFLRDLVISVLHRLRQSRTLHTLTFGPISRVHFKALGQYPSLKEQIMISKLMNVMAVLAALTLVKGDQHTFGVDGKSVLCIPKSDLDPVLLPFADESIDLHVGSGHTPGFAFLF